MPLEIRLKVCEALVVPWPHRPQYNSSRVTYSLSTAYGFHSAVLSVNKQINREVMKVFYEDNIWDFTILEPLGKHQGRARARIQPPRLPFRKFQNRQCIRKVRLLVHICPGQDPNKNLNFTYNDTDNLARLPSEAYWMCDALAEHTSVNSVSFCMGRSSRSGRSSCVDQNT